jgi:protein tyrosine phosphatase (PTP) superfamily phosphohydrolase (DUF442 family)
MIRLLLVILAVFLACCALYYAHWVLIRRRLVTIVRDRVYQSGAMSPPALIRCARRLGIASVVDFRGVDEPRFADEARALAQTDIRYIHLPVGRDPQPEDVRRFVAFMAEERSAGRRVLLHCKDGEGRSIYFSAIYRIEFEGWTPREALQGASRLPPLFRFVSRLCPPAGRFSPRNPKTPLILGYRRLGAPDGSAPLSGGADPVA